MKTSLPRSAKPVRNHGLRRERATGVEPATSSLGSGPSRIVEDRGNEKKANYLSDLRTAWADPNYPEISRQNPEKPERFPL